jgi:pimeloyl-ACP methyl ester carboxylesterase
VPRRRGARVHRHSWTAPPPDSLGPEQEDWVCGEIRPLLDALGGRPLLIGKSLGTHAAALAAERDLPAVWLTPLLTLPWVAGALRRASAPFLLVGGTADEVWDGALARGLSPHVLEVEHADHGMQVPGPLLNSIAVLARVVTALTDFLNAINW